MKPILGLIPLVDTPRESLWMLPGYMEGILDAGGIPIMLPLTTQKQTLEAACALCDGFLLTGGHDVSPAVYGETPLPVCGESVALRDEMERIVLDIAIKNNRPVLGICRGIQLINALLGGTLYQDLPTQHPSSVEHHQSPPYDMPVHAVTLTPDTPLSRLLGKDHLRVNSYHHQAVKVLAPCLSPMAVSEDGLVEALYKPDHPFLWGVQWHPEFAYRKDEDCAKIFSAFVCAACTAHPC